MMCRACCGAARADDDRLWHPWLRINRVFRGILTDAVEPTRATGTGWERTPWHATQRAAWEALKKALKP
jgi:hypothetical protein